MSIFNQHLHFVYGEQARLIEHELKEYIANCQKPTSITKDYWYKFIELYCVYPDGVVYDAKLSPLQNLTLHLQHIKSLGCNAVHILPFLASPMVDKGFDISDYYSIRTELGSFADLQQLVKEAQVLELHLFMDFVFNHVSDQHLWFQKAQQGDTHYRDYFIHTAEKPIFIRKFYQDSAIWGEYIVDGKTTQVNIAFPEHAGPIPHWRQGKDGYWYYHTYYPQQLDLNWFNPHVFIEVAKVLIFWAQIGFNFRLDAIPFVGKAAYKLVSNDNQVAHAITAALKNVLDCLHPESTFIVESYEELHKVIEYFGLPESIQANLSYNFHLCTSLWLSLVEQDTTPLWQKLEKLHQVPSHAEWLNFLRNHDELSLAYLSDQQLFTMRQAMGHLGEDFREGCGIAGRTFSLLGANIERLLMAYFLLASLPGGIVIPYGDEIACANIPLSQLPIRDRVDTRNINRGTLLKAHYETEQAVMLTKQLAAIIGHRKMLRSYLNIWPVRLAAPHTIFAASYKNCQEELLIYINLTPQVEKLELPHNDLLPAAAINSVEHAEELTLGPYAGIWLKRLLP
jgi:maltose alpha-D-glucosyltransferase/alpha-amylase